MTFTCSYAYDVPCYADFTVEAENEKAALVIIRKALRDGRFSDVSCSPCWENSPTNERVFVQGRTAQYDPGTTLNELTKT